MIEIWGKRYNLLVTCMKLCEDKDLTCHAGYSIFITEVETFHIDPLIKVLEMKKNCFLGGRGLAMYLCCTYSSTSQTALICTQEFVLIRYKMTQRQLPLRKVYYSSQEEWTYHATQDTGGSTRVDQVEGGRKAWAQAFVASRKQQGGAE